jgi:hypothetical protein
MPFYRNFEQESIGKSWWIVIDSVGKIMDVETRYVHARVRPIKPGCERSFEGSTSTCAGACTCFLAAVKPPTPWVLSYRTDEHLMTTEGTEDLICCHFYHGRCCAQLLSSAIKTGAIMINSSRHSVPIMLTDPPIHRRFDVLGHHLKESSGLSSRISVL